MEKDHSIPLSQWDWQPKLTANPFLSARDKFEIQQTLQFLAHQIDSALPR